MDWHLLFSLLGLSAWVRTTNQSVEDLRIYFLKLHGQKQKLTANSEWAASFSTANANTLVMWKIIWSWIRVIRCDCLIKTYSWAPWGSRMSRAIRRSGHPAWPRCLWEYWLADFLANHLQCTPFPGILERDGDHKSREKCSLSQLSVVRDRNVHRMPKLGWTSFPCGFVTPDPPIPVLGERHFIQRQNVLPGRDELLICTFDLCQAVSEDTKHRRTAMPTGRVTAGSLLWLGVLHIFPK